MESQRLSIALKSKLIKDSSIEEIGELLRRIMLKIGVRTQNIPNELEALILFEHIVEHYGGNRLDEIRLAWDMAITQGLPDENGEMVEANCYENFSCAYFSKIMTAYRRWSAQEYKLVVKPDAPQQKIFTDAENDNAAREDVDRCYQMFLRGHQIKFPELLEPILRKDELLKDGEKTMSLFEKRAKDGFIHLYTCQ